VDCEQRKQCRKAERERVPKDFFRQPKLRPVLLKIIVVERISKERFGTIEAQFT